MFVWLSAVCLHICMNVSCLFTYFRNVSCLSTYLGMLAVCLLIHMSVSWLFTYFKNVSCLFTCSYECQLFVYMFVWVSAVCLLILGMSAVCLHIIGVKQFNLWSKSEQLLWSISVTISKSMTSSLSTLILSTTSVPKMSVRWRTNAFLDGECLG